MLFVYNTIISIIIFNIYIYHKYEDITYFINEYINYTISLLSKIFLLNIPGSILLNIFNIPFFGLFKVIYCEPGGNTTNTNVQINENVQESTAYNSKKK